MKLEHCSKCKGTTFEVLIHSYQFSHGPSGPTHTHYSNRIRCKKCHKRFDLIP